MINERISVSLIRSFQMQSHSVSVRDDDRLHGQGGVALACLDPVLTYSAT